MQYVFWALVIYLLYRFITGFVWPVYKATTMVKKQFHAMRDQAGQMNNQQNGNSFNNRPSEKPKFDPGGEYIPFQELKEN